MTPVLSEGTSLRQHNWLNWTFSSRAFFSLTALMSGGADTSINRKPMVLHPYLDGFMSWNEACASICARNHLGFLHTTHVRTAPDKCNAYLYPSCVHSLCPSACMREHWSPLWFIVKPHTAKYAAHFQRQASAINLLVPESLLEIFYFPIRGSSTAVPKGTCTWCYRATAESLCSLNKVQRLHSNFCTRLLVKTRFLMNSENKIAKFLNVKKV